MEGLDDFGLTLRRANPDEPAQSMSIADLTMALGHKGEPLEPEQLAELINTSHNTFRLSWNVYQVIRDLVLAAGYDPASVAASHDKAGRLVQNLKPELLATALSSQTNIAERRKLLNTLVDGVPPRAIEVAAVAAARAHDRPLSAPLAALVHKLQTEAVTRPEPVRQQAEITLRSLVHEMIELWSYGVFDTSPTGVEHFFDERLQPAQTDVKPEPERIVKLALEAGAVGPPLWEAVHAMVLADEVRELVGMLKLAPENRASSMIGSQFANPQRLGTLLREPEVDFGSVDVLLTHMGATATETLLEELVASTSRATRRGILERLARLGPGIAPAVIERLLKEERWFVLRNMLHVLREANCSVQNVALPAFQSHTDARVRREAILLLFKEPIARERAVTAGLKDTDSFIIRSSLKEARNGLPDVAVPVLAKRIFDQDFPPEFRVPAIQLLGRSRSVLALDALLRFAQNGTTLLGKPRLAPKSLEMMAALRGLARAWPHERRVKPLLEQAAAATDPHIRAAIEVIKSDSKEVEDDGTE